MAKVHCDEKCFFCEDGVCFKATVLIGEDRKCLDYVEEVWNKVNQILKIVGENK